ncbi:MAG: type II secretion system GspH family protein [Firmicutes bacterium]|nr:type II secretion system GspH family protein [Bacillota bacterium]
MVGGPKAKKAGRGGFTLLEVIIVIGVMGLLAAMIVPFTGYLNNTQRVKLTREKMESIRTALVGPQNVYDAQGAPVVGGYAGHMDRLPKLYRSEWDNDQKTWIWREDQAEDIYGSGQPRGLWLRGPNAGDISPAPGDASDYANWLGPYIAYPTDPYPGNTKSLDWTEPSHRDLFEQRQAEGKLSDAWGRVLYFIKEGAVPDITLLVVSAGPDGKVVLPDAGSPDYNDGAGENRDNIVMKITHSQWYAAGLPDREERTRRSIEKVRDAIIGPADAYDPSGRRLAGGYTGDSGQWPTLWEWDQGDWQVSGDGVGQPRGLWSVTDEVYGLSNGFGWRGPYLVKPWGEGQSEVLRDAWGTPLHFETMHNKVYGVSAGLYIISAGRDKDILTGGDNIELPVLPVNSWLVADMTVRGYVVNDTPKVYEKVCLAYDTEGACVLYEWQTPPDKQPDPVNVQLRLYHRPGATPLETVLDVPAGESRSFALTAGADYICAGERNFEIGVDADKALVVGAHPRSIFIGSGGTQSPVPEKLVLTVRSK